MSQNQEISSSTQVPIGTIDSSSIKYELLSEEYLDQAIDCLSFTFAEAEPMGVALGHTPQDYYDFEVHLANIACRDKLGHVAIDTATG